MPYCYVIYSENTDTYYIGKTTNLPEKRLIMHLTDFYEKRKFTKIADDWKIYWTIECKSIEIAGRIEKHLKNMKSRKYLENLKKNPEIGLKLLQRYQ
jgi:putative endonuclease